MDSNIVIEFVTEETKAATGFSPILDNPLFQAVVGGILVYFVGIFFDRLCIIPYTKYNDLRTKICYCLEEYADTYSNPCHSSQEFSARYVEAQTELRKIASKISSFAQECKFLAKPFIPSKSNLKEIAGWFFALSNGLHDSADNNRKTANAIRLYLNLEVGSYQGLEEMISDKYFKRKCLKKTITK